MTEWTATRVRLLPGTMAQVVGLALAYVMTASPLGSTRDLTVVLAVSIVGVTAVGVVGIGTGRHAVTRAVAVLVLASGFLGFALGPQLWTVGLLLLVATELDRPAVSLALLGLVGGLLALTVATASWRRVATAAVATAVFVVTTTGVWAARGSGGLTSR